MNRVGILRTVTGDCVDQSIEITCSDAFDAKFLEVINSYRALVASHPILHSIDYSNQIIDFSNGIHIVKRFAIYDIIEQTQATAFIVQTIGIDTNALKF